MRRLLVPALIVATVLGIPMLILQRYLAETRGGAIALIAIWALLVGIAIMVVLRGRPDLRLPLAGTWIAVVIGTIVIGYWTGFRDTTVDEEVAIASAEASGEELQRGLSGGEGERGSGSDQGPPDSAGTGGGSGSAQAQQPIELASGAFVGADGHAGAGTATVVEQPNGDRLLTFTEFDVDPGVDVDVYLTATPDDISEGINLGGLRGNVGDQQYEIPAEADLRQHSNVILWCTPFTVRIAVAELDV